MVRVDLFVDHAIGWDGVEAGLAGLSEPNPGPRTRGRRGYSDAHRHEIRRSFIEAGRQLLVQGQVMSLRRIAAETGRSVGAIYQYFPDQRALLAAIRQEDMDAATDAMEAAAEKATDARSRLRDVFLTAARYWVTHPDHFDCLFMSRPGQEVLRSADGRPFGESPSVQRSQALYRRVVDGFFASLARRPMPVDQAMYVLIATTHGVMAFPRCTRSLGWPPVLPMVECALDALLATWQHQGSSTR